MSGLDAASTSRGWRAPSVTRLTMYWTSTLTVCSPAEVLCCVQLGSMGSGLDSVAVRGGP